MKTTRSNSQVKTFTLPAETRVTEEAILELHLLLQNASPEEVRNTLLEIYHVYIMHEHGHLPLVFDEMVSHVYAVDRMFRALAGGSKE